MTMYRPVLFAILLISLVDVSKCQSSLIINEDRPSLIDSVLQVVWEPSSLIRWWTGLDQLYNIALGWRTAAKTLVTLPFREGRSMDHVSIQKPRRAQGMIKLQARHMDMDHFERFNKVYSEGPRPFQQAASSAMLQRHVLPPQFLMRPQQVLPDPNLSELFQLIALQEGHHVFPNEHNGFVQFPKPSPSHQKMTNKAAKPENNVRHPNTPNVFHGNPASSPVAPFPFGGATVPNPEARLRMVLKLLKNLGESHTNKINLNDDSMKEEVR